MNSLEFQRQETKSSPGFPQVKTWKTGYENINSPVCLIQMEKFYRESNQIGEMVKVYKEAVKNSKNSNLETLSLLLGSLYLEEGNPEKTIQLIEGNIHSPKAIVPSLILASAYRKQQDNEHSLEALESASQQAKDAIFNFKCCGCGETLNKWVDHCPACHAFDKMECCPRVNS